MATINGRPVDMTLFPTVTRAFTYQEVSVPPKYEVDLLRSKVGKKTVRYKRGQRVACKTWRDFEDLLEKARTYGGKVEFV